MASYVSASTVVFGQSIPGTLMPFQSGFAPDAVVKDVGREIRGIAAIKESLS
jgi:hypothetical protein